MPGYTAPSFDGVFFPMVQLDKMADDEQNVAEVLEEQTSDSASPSESYTVEVLQIIKEAQQQHGLRHGDHQRYRSYCTRRLRRIRKSIKFVQGHRNKFQSKKVSEENMTDCRFLHIPLFSAERAWSYAMQLKQEANTEPRKKFHLNRRLRKAVKCTEELEALCSSVKCDARSKLEAQAYCAWMKGSLHFESEEWQKAIELFSTAKTIYEKLAGALDDEQQVLYRQRVEEISPNIRYCAYNIGDESAINDLVQMRLKSGAAGDLSSNLDTLIQQTREKQAATLSEVTWRGRTVGVKQEQVRLFLLNVQESEDEISKAADTESKVSIYDSLLMECRDALQALRDEIRNDPKQKTQKADGKVSTLEYLHSYITYIKLTKTIERNTLMADTLKDNLQSGEVQDGKKITKPQDLIRMYDIIIQNLTDIPQLPGLEDDDVLKEDIDNQIIVHKAFRCYYVAQSFYIAKKWVETSALYERVLFYGDQAVNQMKMSSGKTSNKELSKKLEELIKLVKGLKYSVHASAILDTDDTTTRVSQLTIENNKPLVDRLEEYREDPGLVNQHPNLVTFPPDFQPVPCKPLFFDIALNHIEFPSLEDKLEQKKAAPGGGITGFVKGWLWGGKK
ncbi:LOW QUALITY PROTEIN: signal recognition particle subunit SRP68-like [Ptychodera flava]|uniref:LOW QUALITY PROTEIN: signal recognition particle subunit SRP68-like n=1 Tax=Ptychodera flava TaxID=63121 RepID=UPI00396A3CCC